MSNAADVKLSGVTILQSERARIIELFSEYASYTKKILTIDENENVEECEAKYFYILTVLNEAIISKSLPNLDNTSTFNPR